jgi:hypothetical protein
MVALCAETSPTRTNLATATERIPALSAPLRITTVAKGHLEKQYQRTD